MVKASSRRVRHCRSLTEKRALLTRQRASGLSAAAFCRREGVSISSFQLWKRALATPPAASASPFIELLPAGASAPAVSAAVAVEVVWPGGVRLTTSSACDPAWLAAFLRAAVPC